MASLVSTLEMNQQRWITAIELAKAAGAEPGSQRVRDLVRQLVKHGWLRPLPLRGNYEFLPAAAGPWVSGDPWLELRVALRQGDELHPQVALGSAAFLRGLTDRRPPRDLVALNVEASVLPGIRQLYSVIRTKPRRLFGTEDLDGLPVATSARMVLEAAMWSGRAGDLRSEEHWVRPALATANLDELEAGARRLGPAVTSRTGYLADQVGTTAAADRLRGLPRTRPVIFGPRPSSLAGTPFDPQWGVYDTIGLSPANPELD